MKIVVTGGAGFIGSNLVDALVERGDEVLVVDRSVDRKKDNLNDKAEYVAIDITDPGLEKVFVDFRPEAVFHLAAQIDLTKSVLDPAYDAQQNITGTILVLVAAQKAGAKKVVFSSTAAVYGDNGIVPTPEDSPLLAPSPYGINKHTAEQYGQFFNDQHGLAFAALRYANVYGPRQLIHGEGAVIATFCNKAVAGEDLLINGDGEQTRDFVYVKDVVAANIAALESDFVGVCNVGTAHETSINYLAKTIASTVDHDIDIKHREARTVDQRRSALDNTRAQKEINFTPEYNLQQGIAETIAWVKGRTE